ARMIVRQVVAEGAVLGVIGASIGLAAGTAIAHGVLDALGGDLGGGYFADSTPQLIWSWRAALAYGLLGCAAAIAGSWMPAHQAARRHPAQALKSDADETALGHWRSPWPGVALLAIAGGLAWLPPIQGIAV